MDYEQMSRQELLTEIKLLVAENKDLGNELGQALRDLEVIADNDMEPKTFCCCFCCSNLKGDYKCRSENGCDFEWRGYKEGI